MHEMSIMTGVVDSAVETAAQANAERVLAVNLSVGVMTEAIDDAMYFAFELLSEGTLCEGAKLELNHIEPRSLCIECGNEFEHDRFHRKCPKCGSSMTDLIAGRELRIDSIEVDLPD